jgi:hypothetical protein
MIEVTSYVDTRKKDFENIDKVLDIQNTFTGKFEVRNAITTAKEARRKRN